MYKVEEYLERCLKSILSQTLKDIEIILVNDGSPDKCLDMALEYSKADSRIKVIDKINGGLSSARNAGMKAASGDYLGFVDSDDWIMPEMFEKLYYSAVNNNCDMAACNFTWAFEDESEKINAVERKMPEDCVLDIKSQRGTFAAEFLDVRYSLKSGIGPQVWNKIFKRELIEKNNIIFEPTIEIHSEDVLFVYTALLYTNKLSIVNRPLYFYFKRKGSITSSYKPHSFNSQKNLAERLEAMAIEHGLIEEIKPILHENCYIYFWLSLCNECKSRDRFKVKYYRISSFVEDEWLRERILRIDKRSLTLKSRLMYTTYKHKITALTYLMHLYLKKKNKM
jgi:glycosyltransferase EpsH